MKHSYTIITRVLLVLVILVVFSANILAQVFNSKYQDGKVYLKLKDSEAITFRVHEDNTVDISTVPFIQKLASEFNIKELSRPFFINNDGKLLRTLMLEIEDYTKIELLISKLSQEKSLEYVEKVPLDRIDYVPNDTLYNLFNGPQNWNWHLDLINAEAAWDISRGDPNIKVAVVDNAVWVDHPDLAGKVVAQRDVVYNTNSANPPSSGNASDWSHGTHVAGLVGAASDNLFGISSIGFNVSIIAVRASYNTAPNNISGGYQGIQWAANNGANVINMSWGGTGYSQTNQNVINTISNMGIVLISSSGNDNVSTPHYPSDYQNVISVSSVDHNDAKSYFSNYSSTVDISSPGGIASPGPSGVLSTTFSQGPLGYFDAYIGTSMASPIVAGLAGLILSVNPALSPAQVEQILKNNSDDISAQNPTYIGLLGAGRINAHKALLNTPFAPTAAFTTPVSVIIPGTSINFVSQSIGIPTTYQWTFEGATPSSSTAQNPTNIFYHTAGSYDVTLTVSNQFGSSTVTLNDYIQVVTNPSPFIFVNVSESKPCIADVVMLSDSSLYNPVSWDWTIAPSTFQFVNGTSASSANPQVEFLRQGTYNVTLTATNINGSSSKLYENIIHVQGVTPPYYIDMEDRTAEYFVLWDTIKSQSAIDLRSANNSSYGIHFHGDPVSIGWKGSPTSGTPEQAWNENLQFHSHAKLCGVDARGFSNVKLAFDLRQTYSLGPRYSWFRVLVNGIPVSDFEGTVNFNPTTAASDPWRRVQFDLTQFAGQVFDVTLQAATRFADKFQGEGDNVFIDNIEIVNSVPVSKINSDSYALHLFPNPSNGEFSISAKGFTGNATIEVINSQGKVVHSESFTGGNYNHTLRIEKNSTGMYLIRVTTPEKVLTNKIMITK